MRKSVFHSQALIFFGLIGLGACHQADMTCYECALMAQVLANLSASDGSIATQNLVVVPAVCDTVADEYEEKCRAEVPIFWSYLAKALFSTQGGYWDPKYVCSVRNL